MNLNHPEMVAAAEDPATVTKMFINEGITSREATTSTVLDRTVERMVDDRQVRLTCVQLAIMCRPDSFNVPAAEQAVGVLAAAQEFYEWSVQGEPGADL